MEELLKEIKNLEERLKELQEGYGQECVDLYNQKDFDYDKTKWQKKVKKIAKKYAGLIVPLQKKHEELRVKYNEKEEEIRKSKYKNA